ncbi:MAG TPA: hypothetical protein VFV50_19685, partial [Bdellovibrionales bacterium]|nr:hypothetical protein [Bdellovibrionales bacterium]
MKAKLLLSTLVLGLSLVSFAVYAEEDELAKEEQALTEASAKDANFTAALKEKYQLTDEQIKSMQDQGLAAPHMAMTAQLAQSSGKPLDEVL